MITITINSILKSGMLILLISTALQAAPSVYPHSPQQWTQALPPPSAASGSRTRDFEVKGMSAPPRQTKNIVMQQNAPVVANVLFEFNSAAVRPNVNLALDGLGQALRNGLRKAVLIIEGHTDAIGTTEYNRMLSQRRAITA